MSGVMRSYGYEPTGERRFEYRVYDPGGDLIGTVVKRLSSWVPYLPDGSRLPAVRFRSTATLELARGQSETKGAIDG